MIKHVMVKRVFFSAALWIMLALAGVPGSAYAAGHAVVLQHAQPILVITETAAGSQTKVTAYQSYVLSGAGIMTPGFSEIKLSTAETASLGVVPPISAAGIGSTFTSDTDAASAVGTYFNRFEGVVASAAATEMGRRFSRPTGAMYEFVQVVTVAGKNVKAIAGEWVNPNGSYRDLGVHVVDNRDTLLFAIYNQGAVAQGLPPSWTLPNPGTLTWAVADISVNPATGAPSLTMRTIGGSVWHTVDYLHTGGLLGQYGEYDEPQSATTSAGANVDINCKPLSGSSVCNGFAPGATYSPNITFDPNTGLTAMIGNKSTPGPVYNLMQQYNASQAFVVYGRSVAPVYTASGTAGTERAVVAVDIASRKALTQAYGCNDASGGATTFSVAGTIGWMLEYKFDEYIVQSDGSYQYLTSITQSKVAPTQTFSQQANLVLPSGATPASYLANDIVDPWGSGAIYSVYSDTVHGLPASDYIPSPLPAIATTYKHFYTQRYLNGYDVCIDTKDPSNVLINGSKEVWSPWYTWIPAGGTFWSGIEPYGAGRGIESGSNSSGWYWGHVLIPHLGSFSRRDGSIGKCGQPIYETYSTTTNTIAVMFPGPNQALGSGHCGGWGDGAVMYNASTIRAPQLSPNGNGYIWPSYPGWNIIGYDNGDTFYFGTHY